MIYHRKFKDYETYIKVQGHKALNFPDYTKAGEEKRISKFNYQLGLLSQHMREGNVLCLGARTGTEVRVFNELGFKDSLGIDLHPLHDSVLQRDMLDTKLDPDSFDNIFTNSLDHCPDFDKLLIEMNRLLKKDGMFVFITDTDYALQRRTEEEYTSIHKILKRDLHPLNAMFWDETIDIVNKAYIHNFHLSYFKNKGRRIYVCLQKGDK